MASNSLNKPSSFSHRESNSRSHLSMLLLYSRPNVKRVRSALFSMMRGPPPHLPFLASPYHSNSCPSRDISSLRRREVPPRTCFRRGSPSNSIWIPNLELRTRKTSSTLHLKMIRATYQISSRLRVTLLGSTEYHSTQSK